MNIREDADLIQYYKEWRSGADTEIPDSKMLGIAIDTVLQHLKRTPAMAKTKKKASAKKPATKK